MNKIYINNMQLMEKLILLYNKYKNYLQSMDLFIFIIISIIILYFLLYIISFFFKLPVIILLGLLMGYYLYKQKENIKNI